MWTISWLIPRRYLGKAAEPRHFQVNPSMYRVLGCPRAIRSFETVQSGPKMRMPALKFHAEFIPRLHTAATTLHQPSTGFHGLRTV